MSEPTRRILLRIGVTGVLLAGAGCDGFVGEFMILDGFQKRFAQLRPGATRADVVASLGEPQRHDVALHLPQVEGYESEYQRAQASGASSFLYWETGVDEVAVVGLDANDRLVFKCRAGT